MTLPEAVQRQADFADQYDAAIAASNGAKEGEAPTQQVTEGTEHAQTVQTQTTSPEESEIEKVRARYSSLKGKYDSEVPRLNDRNKELEERIQQLLDENAQLRERSAQQEADAPGLTDGDEAQFGAETVDLVRRGVREGTAKQQLEIERLRSQLQQQQEQAARQAEEQRASRNDAFSAAMDRLCPGWSEQNHDQGFIRWLNMRDPKFGFSRQALLNQAAEAYDANRVATIFQAYREEVTAQEAKSPLASQVSPTHTAGSNPPSGPAKWTSDSIARFYEDARHGKYAEEDALRIEKEIDDAVASGQVKY